MAAVRHAEGLKAFGADQASLSFLEVPGSLHTGEFGLPYNMAASW